MMTETAQNILFILGFYLFVVGFLFALQGPKTYEEGIDKEMKVANVMALTGFVLLILQRFM